MKSGNEFVVCTDEQLHFIHPKQMSLITIDQFEEFSEDYPELAQCYDFTYTHNQGRSTEEPIANTSGD